MRQTTKTVIKIIIGAGLVSYFVLSNDLLTIWANFKKITPFVWLGAIAVLSIGELIRVKKWHLLLAEYKYKKLLAINVISGFYILVLPGQMIAETVKAAILGGQEKELEKVGASVVVDKITSFIAIMLLGTIGIIFSNQDISSVAFAVFVSITPLLLFFLFIINIPVFNKTLTNAMLFFKKKFKKATKIIDVLIKSKECWHDFSRDWKTMLKCVLLGCVFQSILCFMLVLFGKPIGVDISIINWFWIHAILAVALFLPITIGGLGVREGGFIALLGLLDVPPEKALVISFGSFGMNIIRAVFGGILEILRNTRKTY